jgi:hypothetical protein
MKCFVEDGPWLLDSVCNAFSKHFKHNTEELRGVHLVLDFLIDLPPVCVAGVERIEPAALATFLHSQADIWLRALLPRLSYVLHASRCAGVSGVYKAQRVVFSAAVLALDRLETSLVDAKPATTKHVSSLASALEHILQPQWDGQPNQVLEPLKGLRTLSFRLRQTQLARLAQSGTLWSPDTITRVARGQRQPRSRLRLSGESCERIVRELCASVNPSQILPTDTHEDDLTTPFTTPEPLCAVQEAERAHVEQWRPPSGAFAHEGFFDLGF